MWYKIFFWLIFLYLFSLAPPRIHTEPITASTYYPPMWQFDNMGRNDKEKLQKLAKDLMVDAKIKVRQLLSIVHDHSTTDGYQYGYLIGKIREHYRNMLEIYKTAYNRIAGFNRSLILPPATVVVRPIHYIHYMQEIHMLERDIDEMVYLMEWIKKGAATLHPSLLPGHAPPLVTKRSPKRPGRQGREEKQARETKLRLRGLERSVKSKLREEHLMRRLGLPVNTSTTKKRFLDRWPVEDTWKLNEYETF